MKEWRASNKDYRLAYHQLRKYGLSIEDRDRMLAEQGGVCAICGTDNPGTSNTGNRKAWSTDHCHSTGEVRGLLCSSCNVGIGHLKDDTSILASAINYLNRTSP